jgi:hypothetical protein
MDREGSDTTHMCVIRVHYDRFFSRVLSYGNLGIGEAYMDHDFE